ncbi:hypothetical protein SBF1_1650012 [Candidatus Desulfosporosinus infrequens]|uniref:Uncharacterized protein n=1 Tax=Candidatus Desulfosporosinus infrequens TaxID=2043169 RepID=A0A2U3KAP8_9FIRM|nr:hypothetical protein SBF1_1650012 [Candidatus Desulfosporosinus infrequens]
MGVGEETIIINYLKATGLNRAFINFVEYQLRYKAIYILELKMYFLKSVLICVNLWLIN